MYHAPTSGGKRMHTVRWATLVVVLVAAVSASGGASTAQTQQQRRMARGKYLVEGPAHCFGCHSDADVAHGTDQPIRGRKGAGTVFPEPLQRMIGLQPPFQLVCPNITPDKETGAGTWSDEAFVHALRQGVGHDGRVLFPIMPYQNFQLLSDEDLASIIAYVRSIPAVRNPLPKTSLPPQLKAILQPLSAPKGPVTPDLSTPEKRGAYLVRLGNCSTCHTPVDDKQQPLPGMYLAGGRTFPTPWGDITSVNLTPDASGISYYTPQIFIQTIRTGHVGARKLNPLMPFSFFRNMTDSDLSDILAYLRTVPKVQHRVDNTEVARECKLCRGKHGFGEKNPALAAGQ